MWKVIAIGLSAASWGSWEHRGVNTREVSFQQCKCHSSINTPWDVGKLCNPNTKALHDHNEWLADWQVVLFLFLFLFFNIDSIRRNCVHSMQRNKASYIVQIFTLLHHPNATKIVLFCSVSAHDLWSLDSPWCDFNLMSFPRCSRADLNQLLGR